MRQAVLGKSLAYALGTILWFFTLWDFCFAGGYAIPQQTAKALALSNALTAGVDDPSAVYYNPAALSEVEGNQLLGGMSYINVVSSVENSGSTARNRSNNNFTGSFFGNAHIPGSDFTVGVGVYTPFGLSTEYDGDSIARYAATKGQLSPLYLNWAAAWHPNEYLSLGGGVSWVRSGMEVARHIYLFPVTGSNNDGRAKITANDQSATFNLGLLLKHPDYPVKFGITYRGRTYLNFKGGDVEYVDFNGTPFNTRISRGSIVLPSVVSAGLNWQVTPRWSLDFVYDWTKWNDLRTLKLVFAQSLPAAGGAVPIPGLTVPANWKNTSTLRFGSTFHLNESWDLMGGFALDETPIPNETLGPLVPGADIFAVNGGVTYSWKKVKITAAYMAVFYQTRRVQNNVLEAGLTPASPLYPPGTPGKDKYETFNNFFSLSVSYRF